jgi:hypothetical protein
MIRADNVSLLPRLLYLVFGFLIPFFTLLFSNLALCKMARASSTNLKNSRQVCCGICNLNTVNYVRQFTLLRVETFV